MIERKKNKLERNEPTIIQIISIPLLPYLIKFKKAEVSLIKLKMNEN